MIGYLPVSKWKFFFVLLIAASAILLGLFITPDFGHSWDEYANASYGRRSLQQYASQSVFVAAEEGKFGQAPFYFMLFTATSDLLRNLIPGWLATDGRHFTTFLMFLLGLVAFYSLAKRLLNDKLAIVSTLLFATQPLYFGHGFINQKDIPFVAFFTAAIVLGLAAVDQWQVARIGDGEGQFRKTVSKAVEGLKSDWASQPKWTFGILLLILGASGLVLFDLFAEVWLLARARDIVALAYDGSAPGIVNRAFETFATDAYKTTKAEYLDKLTRYYRWARLIAVPVAAYVLLVIVRPLFPHTRKAVSSTEWSFVRKLALAAFVLGIASATREAGPLAGVLIAIYWLLHGGYRAIPAIAIYGLLGFGGMYLLWPALWGNPIGWLVGRFSTVTDFTAHFVLFQGIHFSSRELPRYYLPLLLSIQHTIPAVLLTIIGVLVSPYKSSEVYRQNTALILLLGLWFGIPFIGVVLFGTPIYGNFRHLFFSIPPLFIFTGLGLKVLIKKVENRVGQYVLIAAILLPGVIGLVRNHPYQYVYYNALVGGVSGAEGRFEADHWCTSYRQAMAFVNETATQGARVAVSGPLAAAAAFARDDLDMVPAGAEVFPGDFALACKNSLDRPGFYPELELVYQVELHGVVLAQVKKFQ